MIVVVVANTVIVYVVEGKRHYLTICPYYLLLGGPAPCKRVSRVKFLIFFYTLAQGENTVVVYAVEGEPLINMGSFFFF